MSMPHGVRLTGWVSLLVMLAACSNGRGSLEEQQQSPPSQNPQTPPPTAPAQESFSIGGTVTGLTGGSLVLQNNGAGDLTISLDGPFSFPTSVAAGTAYNVTVATQPAAPPQVCTVSNGAGAATTNVTNIAIACSAAPRYTVGGNASGLASPGLVIQNNQGDDLPVSANGPFTFATPVVQGGAYNVIVKTQPSNQNCVVRNGTGTIATTNVDNVELVCATNQYTVGGTATGLAGAGLVLQVNGGGDLAIAKDGPFAFPVGINDATAYEVKVKTQPNNPTQECVVTNGTGTIAGANVSTVAVTCTTSSFRIGGTIGNLAAGGLVLRLNGANDLPISGNGSFQFPTPLLSGTTYAVTVRSEPQNPVQTCTVVRGTGIVLDANITNVRVVCATQTFAIGGSVSGLLGSGLVLRNNGGNDLPIAADGTFKFPTEVSSGGTYNVTVQAQPKNPTQACSVVGGTGSGTVGAADITNVAITCSTSNFTVGGTITNLAGSGLILRNNGGDDLNVAAGGAFTFATAIPSGTPYNITVAQQPTNPNQTCSVTNGTGTVTETNVASVSVDCVTTGVLIGGNVSGLNGPGLVLQNNGGDDLQVAANGPFQFATLVLPGGSYNVTIAGQPIGQLCGVLNGSGIAGTTNVQNIQITCIGGF